MLNLSRDSGLSTGSGTTIALRLADTSSDGGAGTWNTTQQFTAVQFYSADASGSGAAIRASVGATMEVASGGTTALTFMTNSSGTPAERARIDSSGNLLVGTTANIYTSRLNVKSSGDNNAAQFYRQGTTSASAIVIFNSNSGGTETLKSYIDTVSGLLVTTSDERLKENIVGIGYGLQQISALRPVSFEWINSDGKTNLGFIAQEVETVIPEAVTTLDESMSKSINSQKMLDKDTLIPVLVKAIQEQQALIQTLTDRITALETPTGTQA
jgi:hypothetical protein